MSLIGLLSISTTPLTTAELDRRAIIAHAVKPSVREQRGRGHTDLQCQGADAALPAAPRRSGHRADRGR